MDLSDGENKTILSVYITQNQYLDFYSDTDYANSYCLFLESCEEAIDISVWHIDYKMNED